MDLEYTQRLAKIETELERWLPKNPDAAWTQQVFAGENVFAGNETDTAGFSLPYSSITNIDTDTIQFLIAPLRELLFRGGKRWRPLLMTLVCETFGGGDSAVPLSPVVEFSHNASLIHDDIEDESDERRGKPAVHKIYGVDTAINSGSFFYFLASCCIQTCELSTNPAEQSYRLQNKNEQTSDAKKSKEHIYNLWTECMRKLHLGQAMDINWHRNVTFIPEVNEYLAMSRFKTGSLARFAAELGVYMAGAPPEAAQILGNAADMMGVGFQILDDVKNLTTGIPGKKRGDDIVEGKKSLPVLLYMHKYPEKRERVFYCFNTARQYGGSIPEIDELINIFAASGVFEEAEEKGRSFLKKTQDVFSSVEFSGFTVNKNSFNLLDNFIKLIS